MSKLLNKIRRFINKDIDKQTDTQEEQAISFYSTSTIQGIFSALGVSLVCYLFSLHFALYTYLIGSVLFLLGYLLKRIIPIEIIATITSCMVATISIIVFTYYGISYGFQFLILISIVIALVNTRNKKHRQFYFFFVLSSMALSCFMLIKYGAVAPPLKYGNAVNLIMIGLSVIIAFQHTEIYMKLYSHFEEERFSEMNDLKRKNQDFKEFNYSVAHDLKDPLKAIEGFANLLFKNTAPEKQADSEEYNGYISKSVSRMSKLLDDLMAYIEATDKQTLSEVVDLNKVLLHVKDNLSKRISDKHVTLSIEELPWIKANETCCVLLFQNFLANAIKFVAQDVKPIIQVTTRKTKDGIFILITDNGIGILAADKEKIFGAFQRLNSKTKYEGSGLGLSMCQKIVAAWEGEITVESELGKGSTFKIFIPQAVILEPTRQFSVGNNSK